MSEKYDCCLCGVVMCGSCDWSHDLIASYHQTWLFHRIFDQPFAFVLSANLFVWIACRWLGLLDLLLSLSIMSSPVSGLYTCHLFIKSTYSNGEKGD